MLNDAAHDRSGHRRSGPSKYQDALVNTLFDEMRTAMNAALADAQALLCIGFGFNDDHLQGVIKLPSVTRHTAIIVTATRPRTLNNCLANTRT